MNEFYRTLGDTITFADIEIEGVVKVLSDSFSIAEGLAKTFNVGLSDTISLTEEISPYLIIRISDLGFIRSDIP